MNERIGVLESLRITYSFARVQWLIGAAAINLLIYLSSDEIWRIGFEQPFPIISLNNFLLYLLFFLVVLLFVHYYDVQRIASGKWSILFISIVSIVVDVTVIMFFELILLYTINVLPQDILKALEMLLLGAMPASLGSIVLSSLTAENLKKRAKNLLDEVSKIGNEIRKLEEQKRKAVVTLEEFKKKQREFEHFFEEQKKDKRGNVV